MKDAGTTIVVTDDLTEDDRVVVTVCDSSAYIFKVCLVPGTISGRFAYRLIRDYAVGFEFSAVW